MRTKNFVLLIALQAFFTIPFACASDLPSERSLPARPGSTPNGASMEMPSESILPKRAIGKLHRETGIAVADSQAAYIGIESKDLPTESQLPTPPPSPSDISNPSVPSVPTDDASSRGDLEKELFKDEGETTPWPRLIQDGHTAAITAIAFSPDGKSLYTAGRDKLVHVWVSDENNQWTHRDTVRWQVGRGPSGTIGSVLATDTFLFLSGYAVKAQREIGVLDRITLATLSPMLNTNDLSSRDTMLVDLSSNNELRMMAGDSKGGVVRWEFDRAGGKWESTRLRDATQARKGFTTLARVGDTKFALPVTTDKNTNLAWHVDVADSTNGKTVETLKHDATPAQGLEILGALFEEQAKSKGKPWDLSTKSEIVKRLIPQSPSTCIEIVSSPSGKFVAALDDKRWLYVWETGKGLVLKYRQYEADGLSMKEAPFDFTCIAWTDSEGAFLVGERNITNGRGRIQKWTQNSTGRFRMETAAELDKSPSHITVRGNSVALDSGPKIQLRILGDLSLSGELGRNYLRAPKQIQWSQSGKIGWKWLDVSGNEHAMGIVSTEQGEARLQLLDSSARQWLPQPSVLNGELPKYDRAGNLMVKIPSIGTVGLEMAVDKGESISSRYGPLSTSCWILDSNSKPIGFAVCFEDDSEIRVFGFPTADTKVCPLWRVFRGHEDTINAIQCSQDGRYLATSSQDRRMCIWPLMGWDAARDAKSDPMGRWGLEAEVGADGIDVVDVAPEGPLYSRGVRNGDRIVKLAWTEPNAATGKLETASTEVPREIWRRLGQANFETNFAFWYQREQGVARQGFKRVCQWEPLLTVAVSTEREWAAWTPLGFYDASFNGDQLFGWQLNRGPDKRPDFLPANRFRASLERPDVIGRLLDAGNILKAFEKVAAQMPGGPNGVLSNVIALQPTVEIDVPPLSVPTQGNQIRIRANVRMQRGQTLTSSRAFINGVVATNFRSVGPSHGIVDPEDPNKRLFVVEWEAAIPSDRRLKYQVFVETAEHNVGVGEVVIDRGVEKRTTPRSSLYVVTAGVSQYRDPSLNLNKPSINAKRVAESLSSNAIFKQDSHSSVLTDSMVTPVAWRSAIETMAGNLQGNVSPDDVILIYLTGHGIVDPVTEEYYFVTSRASTRDLRAAKYEDCLSLSDLASLRKVACRKLVILDTCHSGAAQLQSPSRLKQAVRTLQNDQIFVMTASDGNQLAFEDAFTDPLKEAFDGRADENNDKLVSLQEAFQFVKEKMKKQSKPQYPTLGPIDLIDFADFSIVRTKPSEKLTSVTASPTEGAVPPARIPSASHGQ